LARVAASGAPLWLLDEPTNGLDAASISRLAGIFAAQRASGGMILASTHTDLDLPGAEILRL
jgi:heme exporter protein A